MKMATDRRQGVGFIVASSILLALAASPAENLRAQEPVMTGNTQFGQFGPSTDAERELERMLRGKDEDIDLASANWLLVADVPEFRDLTREAYLKQLDEMTDQVRQSMAKMEKVARSRGQNPNAPD